MHGATILSPSLRYFQLSLRGMFTGRGCAVGLNSWLSEVIVFACISPTDRLRTLQQTHYATASRNPVSCHTNYWNLPIIICFIDIEKVFRGSNIWFGSIRENGRVANYSFIWKLKGASLGEAYKNGYFIVRQTVKYRFFYLLTQKSEFFFSLAAIFVLAYCPSFCLFVGP